MPCSKAETVLQSLVKERAGQEKERAEQEKFRAEQEKLKAHTGQQLRNLSSRCSFLSHHIEEFKAVIAQKGK